LLDPSQGLDGEADLVIEDGRVAAIEKPGTVSAGNAEVVEAGERVVTPGFIDMHVHLREPGYEYKETIASGCMAAVIGGVTSLACMANTDPVNDSAAVTSFVRERAKLAGLANVFPVGAVSVGLQGRELAEFGEMYEAGIVAVSDDGMPVMDSHLMRRALEYAKLFGFPVIVHEEDSCLCSGGVMNEGVTSVELGLPGMPPAGESTMVARDIELARFTGGRLHVAHVSVAESVEMIRRAKHEGLAVSAEVSPHHLTLDERAVVGYDTHAKVKPPLRTAADIECLCEGLADGTIDTIATDHAPHHRDEKALPFGDAAFGMIGLETMLPLCLELVRRGQVTMQRLVEALTSAPAANLNLDRGRLAVGKVADVTVFDPDREWTFDASESASKSNNSPFDGWRLRGKVTQTFVAGRSVWEDQG